MLYTVLRVGMLLFGLILLVIGAALLLKVSNQLPGWLAIAVGVLFTFSPIAVFLTLMTI